MAREIFIELWNRATDEIPQLINFKEEILSVT